MWQALCNNCDRKSPLFARVESREPTGAAEALRWPGASHSLTRSLTHSITSRAVLSLPLVAMNQAAVDRKRKLQVGETECACLFVCVSECVCACVSE